MLWCTCPLTVVLPVATNLCFGEKNVYTSEVLAVVMQQLMEQTPLPILLMRTVIQSLTMYPRLAGFVMNILARLILKQVWKYPKVWEGFVKCCQRTKPQSYNVLLQLPPAQLASVFERCPEMRDPLLQHVHSFTPHQQAHIPSSIIAILEANIRKLEPEPEPQLPEVIEERQIQIPKHISAPVPQAEPPAPAPIAFTEPVPEPIPSRREEVEEPMEQAEAAHAFPVVTSEPALQQMEVSEDATQSSTVTEKADEPMEESTAGDVADQTKVVPEDADTEPEPETSNVD